MGPSPLSLREFTSMANCKHQCFKGLNFSKNSSTQNSFRDFSNSTSRSNKMFRSASNKLVSKCSEHSDERKFNFDIFLNNMKNCILTEQTETDIDLKYYLIAYDQLYNFFLLLGGAFQFVATDVKSKIKILNGYRDEELKNSETIINFSTMESMVNYEKDKNLLYHPTYVSGCRTLLRLHRGLDFFRKFLREMYSVSNQTKLCGIARQVYDQTLAEYHTFVIRNSARLAMQLLPTRLELLNKISCNNEGQISHMLQLFPDLLDIMDVVYDRMQYIFIENELLNLP